MDTACRIHTVFQGVISVQFNSTVAQKNHTIQGLFTKEYVPTQRLSKAVSILMIHGGCHGWWAFEKWGPHFADKGWKVFASSLRNHTDSYSIPTAQYIKLSLKDYVDDVFTVVRWIDGPFILLGHSMGGLIAQKLAEITEPQALVLVSSVGPGQLGKMRDPYPEDSPIVVDAVTARALWFHDINDAEFDSISQRLVPESTSVVNEYSGGHVKVNRAAITCPILVTGGEEDVSPVHKQQSIAEFYGIEHTLFPNCGHDLMLERRAFKAADFIDEWLTGLGLWID
jgi:pimeloyl-ACP methyl ester carboxylesterase